MLREKVKQSVWMCTVGHYHNDLHNQIAEGFPVETELESFFKNRTPFSKLPEEIREEYIEESEALIKAGL